jgi:hypothetical protein
MFDKNHYTKQLEAIRPILSKVESGRIAIALIEGLLSQVEPLAEENVELKKLAFENPDSKTLAKVRALVGFGNVVVG